MSITERKNKDGTISFKIEASNGYKINHNGNYVQVRKYKTFKQPKNMGLREARKIAKEFEIEFQRQFERDQNTGVEMRLEEVWKSYEKFYAPNMLRDKTFYYLKNIAEIKNSDEFTLSSEFPEFIQTNHNICPDIYLIFY